MSEQLILAGFHRSGTSLIARLLRQAGLFLGYRLLGSNPSNQYGHFEDAEIVNLHKQILSDNERTWIVTEPFAPVITDFHWQRLREIIERRNAEHGLWGFKDPRVCLFMPLWKHRLPDSKVLLIYRHFSDSTFSLGKRHSNALLSEREPLHLHRKFWEEPDLALRLWLMHNNALLAFARAYPEDILTVSLDMVQDGFPLIWAINHRWGWNLNEVPVAEVFDPAVTERQIGRQPVSDRRLIGEVEETWRALENLGRRTELMIGG